VRARFRRKTATGKRTGHGGLDWDEAAHTKGGPLKKGLFKNRKRRITEHKEGGKKVGGGGNENFGQCAS